MYCNSTTTTFSVPTKTEDNCSYSTSLMQQIVGQESKPKFDAFQHYSSDLLRLKTLLLSPYQDDDELSTLAELNRILRGAGLSDIKGATATKPKRRRGNNSRPTKQDAQRKTRLSWELHPSLFLHDLDQKDQDVEEVHETMITSSRRAARSNDVISGMRIEIESLHVILTRI